MQIALLVLQSIFGVLSLTAMWASATDRICQTLSTAIILSLSAAIWAIPVLEIQRPLPTILGVIAWTAVAVIYLRSLRRSGIDSSDATFDHDEME
ncbi:hypothetical protein [Nocardia sp. NBC_01388]|uniref:hypothetical protein n=1 Tax=Nocardia sp. NBC_01388 TaxID=2903596 RepID=UPI003243940B